MNQHLLVDLHCPILIHQTQLSSQYCMKPGCQQLLQDLGGHRKVIA
jgi:hypothetical protein